MFLDRFTFLQSLLPRSRRFPPPQAERHEDDEHELDTFRRKSATRPALRTRLFSTVSSKSARSARSARSNPRIQGEREEKRSLIGQRLAGRRRSGVDHHSQPSKSGKALSIPKTKTLSTASSSSPPKSRRLRYNRRPKNPPPPVNLQLPHGRARESLDAEAADLQRKITAQRQKLASDLRGSIKPFPL